MNPAIVLGLGNPGVGYRNTRHNLGFWVVERLARKHRADFRSSPGLVRRVRVAEIKQDETVVVLAKSRTYMNRSGSAASTLCAMYGIEPERLVVVHDDADLELGRIRVRPSGSAGGHNGIRSLIGALRTEAFPRIRLGVRGEHRGEIELADYVLDPFEADEFPTADALAQLGTEAVEAVIRDGVPAAMNRFNGARALPPETEKGN